MQAATILAALQRAATGPALAGINIKTVQIAAVRDWTHNPLMTITWSMPDASAAIASAELSLPGVQASVISRPSDTAIMLDRGLASPGEIEDAVIGAAWTLGAWDLIRLEHAPLAACEEWQENRHGINCSFGRNGYTINGQELVTGDQADDDTCELAASVGYVLWRFVPLHLATRIARQRWASKDKTLLPDCTRAGVPGSYRAPWCCPTEPRTANEHQYQLGRANHGNRAKASQDRRA
jgi:hypothetical protein